VQYRFELRASVREYLRHLPLTRNGRVRLNAGLIQMVGEVADTFRADPDNRFGPSSPFYHFTWIFEDNGRFRTLFVVVDDSTAAYGVLRIVYADCQ
jgi:hypothetical protein